MVVREDCVRRLVCRGLVVLPWLGGVILCMKMTAQSSASASNALYAGRDLDASLFTST